MDTTPMTFNIEVTQDEWQHHPIYKEWASMKYHPVYGYYSSPSSFFKQEYNIIIEHYQYSRNANEPITVEFKSEQDYILWKLHQ